MLRKSLPKITILIALCANLAATPASAQATPAGEVDVTKCWSYPSAGEGGSEFVSDGMRLYLDGSGGRVQALSLGGEKLWASEFGGDIDSNLLAAETGLFLATSTLASETNKSAGNLLRSLSKETGITSWTAKLADSSEYFLGTYQSSIVVVSKNGIIQSIDAKTAAVKWKREIAEGFAAEPRFFAEKLVVASTAKQVFTISLATGEIDSVRKLPFQVSAVGRTAAGDLIVGDERGNLTSFAVSTEKVNWKFRSGGEISSVIAIDDHILVTSHDNFAYSIVTKNGSVAWKRRLAGRVSRVATFEDRYALISGFDDHVAVLSDLTDGKIAGQIGFGDDETLIYRPIISSGLIFIMTGSYVRAFSLNGCPAKKQSGPGK